MRDFMNVGALPKIYETRKLSESFDFKRGHKFGAEIKVVSDDNTSIMLKLKDGTEIVAKLDVPLKDIIDGFAKFEVSGFENGQLKLKLVKDEVAGQGNKTLNDSLELILNKFGLEPEKKQMLEKMLKFNIPVTKENVELLNTLTDFRDKSMSNPKHIANFIETYIAIKGANISPKQKPIVEQKLNEFFKSFATMSDKDIMTFLENDIDINEKNIKSFENVTKNSNGVFKDIESASDELEKIIKGTPSDAEKVKVSLGSEDTKASNLVSENLNSDKSKLNIGGSPLNNQTENIGEKSNNLNMVQENTIKGEVEKNIDPVNIEIKATTDKIENIKGDINSLIKLDFEVLKNPSAKGIIENLASELKQISKEVPVSEKLIAVLDKVIKNFDGLDKSSSESLKNVFDFARKEIIKVEQDFASLVKEKVGETVSKDVRNSLGNKEFDGLLRDFKEVKIRLNDKQEYMKNAIRNLADKLCNNETTSQMVMSVLKDKIADFKMFNNLSNEYYYLDVPLNMREEEYPCKLIIKDERKDGKKLDGKNIKLAVSVKTVSIGSVDALINVCAKNIKIDLKVNKVNMNLLEKNKDKLHKALEQLEFMPYIFVSEKKEIVESSISDFREFFSDGNTIALDKKV
ncbi:MAG: hypothetical protein ACRC6T_14175 [Sarcina sp.]